jgi:hypothetical protein
MPISSCSALRKYRSSQLYPLWLGIFVSEKPYLTAEAAENAENQTFFVSAISAVRKFDSYFFFGAGKTPLKGLITLLPSATNVAVPLVTLMGKAKVWAPVHHFSNWSHALIFFS